MQRMMQTLKRGMLLLLALVLVAGYPLSAMAETQEPVTPPPAETTTTPSTPPTEPSEPAPAAEPEEPKLTYTYDEATQKWNSEKWVYNPATGAYEAPKPIVIEPPAQVKDENKAELDKTSETTVGIDNKIMSDAVSGNSSVIGNTLAGNATTGDAAAVANLMNVVNSTVTMGDNQKVATFTQDILGDVKGDIMLYPSLLKAMLEAEASQYTDTTINTSTNFDINNDIVLKAKSGDATVAKNTTGGDATSGSAYAMANVVNILNSMIAAQDSFVGTINIYGNLEGDILVAPDFMPQMLASNADIKNTDVKLSTSDTTEIVNNISAVAESGAANVFGNTSAGNATTGDAESNVVIFNVTGHDVVAANSLLVFVNVLGKWVGMIIDAPAGATAAMLGSGVTKNEKIAPDLTVNAQTSHGITNTIAISAESGDAVVAENTSGGNATTGQAKALANVANVSGSQFGVTDWFGVLFINVFQDWYGDFGNDTAYGGWTFKDTVVDTPAPGPVEFIPAPNQTSQPAVNLTVVDSRVTRIVESTIEDTSMKSVLASETKTTQQPTGDELVKKVSAPEQQSFDYRLWIIAGSVFVIGASALGIRRLLQ